MEESMQIEHVTDRGGATLKLQVVGGQYYPTFPTSVIKNMASIKIRDDDVILAGYLKAGTHWVWEILRMLLAGTTEVENIEKDSAMMEQTEQKLLDLLPSPRVLNTHVLFENLPTQVLTRKPKIIYLTRNPKDTAVSMYHHHTKLQQYYSYSGTLDDYLHLFWQGKDYGSWADHIKSWTKAIKDQPQLDIWEVNYEDMSEDPDTQIHKMAEFLQLSPPDKLVDDILNECSLQSMRAKKGQFDLDPEGNSIMYRKGEVGGWKQSLTETQSLWFDQIYTETMTGLDTPYHWRFDL